MRRKSIAPIDLAADTESEANVMNVLIMIS
jgi:hypothetical protein